MERVGAAAPSLGLRVLSLLGSLHRVDGIHPIIQLVSKKKGVNVLFVCTDPLITTNADILNEWALLENLATMHAIRENCGKQGLMFYGPKFPEMFGRAADFVDMILRVRCEAS